MLRFPQTSPIDVLNPKKLSMMTPSLFQPSGLQIDDLVREMLVEDLAVMARLPQMQNAYDIERAGTGIFYRVPWLVNAFGLDAMRRMNVVEIGCGIGVKGLPWSRLFQSYLGVDLDADNIAIATALRNELGRTNAEFVCDNASVVAARPSAFGVESINLLILYAVLEHLTIPERRAILEMSSSVIADGGYVVLCETPNRLLPFDSHSSEMHFYQSLPPELALSYVQRSPLRAARETVTDELSYYRFGNALSYHEFDLWLHDGSHRAPGILADGWSAWAMHDQPVRREEFDLTKYLVAKDLAPPLFGRYWLDGVFGGPRESPPSNCTEAPELASLTNLPVIPPEDPFVTPTQVVVEGDAVLTSGPTKGQRVLVVDLANSSGVLQVSDPHGQIVWESSIHDLTIGRFPRWHVQAVIDFSAIANPAHPLSLKVMDGTYYGPGFVT